MMIERLLDWRHLSLAHPLFLLLLILIPILLWWQKRQQARNAPALRLTTLNGIALSPSGGRARYRPLLKVLRVICLTFLIIALARPQSGMSQEMVDSEGIDIVLALDVSGSMLAEDFTPNRIEAAKKVADDFIEHRPGDRIGLVIFSGEAFTQCPVTIDHAVLRAHLAAMEIGMLPDGTAIGDGLATAVRGLRSVKGKSKIIILLTDGVNNRQQVDPGTALEIAKAFNVRVYTIGVGTQGMAPTPVQTPMGMTKQMMPVEIDEALLQKIAKETGGSYFRATGNTSLATIYTSIDKLEKTKVETSTYKQYTEMYLPFAVIALIALGVELLLRYTVFRSITQ